MIGTDPITVPFRAWPHRLPLLGTLLLFWTLLATAQAPISEAKVEALVEALRLSAPQAGAGLYSDWQVKP